MRFMRTLRPALVAIGLMTFLTGLVYPLIVTGLGQLAFPDQANGSLVRDPDGAVRGSALVGQGFARPGYFWSRPSHAGAGWDAAASSGSNLGPLHPDLHRLVRERIAALRAADAALGGMASPPRPVPVDLVTASASGLDPHISPAAARFQVARVAAARGAPPGDVLALVRAHTRGPALGVLGEPTVDVLALNRALDSRWPLGPR